MLCPRCGNPNDNARFCRHCGLEMQMPQPPAAETERLAVANTTPSLSHPGGTPDLLTNRTLDQRYYLEARLGAGGMGVVYRARRLMIGDIVAVKVLHSDLAAEAQAVERFRREAQAAALLKHPNLVTIYDFGVTPDRLVYFVMELVAGMNLRNIIRDQGPLPPATAAEIVSQVCAALDEAHRQGVVHRDLKPENVIVQNTPTGLNVKVLDFGIANLCELTTSRLTPSGSVMGTPQYMSPEQCQGEALDGRSDIYSLGVILYEMLTGCVPFDSPTPTAIAIKHVNQPPPPLRAFQPHLSPAVEVVVLRALAKQREARTQTAGALAQELFAAITNVPGATPLTAQSSPTPVYVSAPPEEAPTPPWGNLVTPFTAQSGSTPGYVSAPPEEAPAPSWADLVTPSFELPSEPNKSYLAPLLVGLLLLLTATAFGFWWFKSGVETRSKADKTPTPANNQTASVSSNSPVAAPGLRDRTAAPSLGNNYWEVISAQTTETINAENVSDEPDQKVATIKPGGQIAINFRAGQFFGDGPGADLRVYGPEDESVSYTVFVRDNPAEPWIHVDINRRRFPHGMASHDIGHHGVRRARQVLIRNDGSADLHIDAVVAVYKDTIGVAQEHHHKH